MSTISKEKAAFLWNELMEYEKNTELTDKERMALREWVAYGNSVHENAFMSFTEAGVPSDFIDSYRYEEEIRQEMEDLSPKAQKSYLSRLRGEETIDNLREDLSELHFRTTIYEQVLRRYGLFEKAGQCMQEARMKGKAFDEWLAAQPIEELPFQ